MSTSAPATPETPPAETGSTSAYIPPDIFDGWLADGRQCVVLVMPVIQPNGHTYRIEVGPGRTSRVDSPPPPEVIRVTCDAIGTTRWPRGRLSAILQKHLLPQTP